MILSKSEFRVAKLAVIGLSTKDIAERLFVTESCIKGHLRSIYKKMKCNGRNQLISQHGLALQNMELPEIAIAPQFDASRDREFEELVDQAAKDVVDSFALPRGACDGFPGGARGNA